MRSSVSFLPLFTAFPVALVVVSCGQGSLEANGLPSHSILIKAGQTLELTLQTIGPGEYARAPRSKTRSTSTDTRRLPWQPVKYAATSTTCPSR